MTTEPCGAALPPLLLPEGRGTSRQMAEMCGSEKWFIASFFS